MGNDILRVLGTQVVKIQRISHEVAELVAPHKSRAFYFETLFLWPLVLLKIKMLSLPVSL